jgi:hypothetical protein
MTFSTCRNSFTVLVQHRAIDASQAPAGPLVLIGQWVRRSGEIHLGFGEIDAAHMAALG